MSKTTTPTPQQPDPKELVTIKLPRDRKEEKRVFVSVNNHTYSIARGVEVQVPRYIAEIIDNAEKQKEASLLQIEAYTSASEERVKQQGL